ncbi:MAG TPA: hypothetical protein VFE28_04105, partial [Candidatus Krumholzibacteria bacterium]|nr:hypothetical protein [Candidatus Krumholzibacteria bacterium]
RRSAKSPGLSEEARHVLERRGVKHACHSDEVPDADDACEEQQHVLEVSGVAARARPESTLTSRT